MIRLLLFAFLYIGNFSSVNSLQFTGRGFCAATEKGVFVYDMSRGIVASLLADNPYIAAYDPSSGELAYVDAHGVLSYYSTFFGTIKRIGQVSQVKGIGIQNGVIMLIYRNGAKRFITRLGQPAPHIYMDTMKIAKDREIPMYLRTRTYQNVCYAFYRATSFARGYNYDYVGTNGTGVFIFDRTMKRKLSSVFLNIEPPIYRLIRVFDTVYVLHSRGITKISGKYNASLTTNCFQNGFYPVDILFGEKENYVINRHGYYTQEEPFFFTPFSQECGDAQKVVYDSKGGIVVLRHCLIRITDKGIPRKLLKLNKEDIQDAGITGENLYLILNGRLVRLNDTLYTEVDYKKEPVIASRIIQGIGRVYIPAKRGVFLVDGEHETLIRSPFNMLDVTDGVEEEGSVYFSLKTKVVELDVNNGAWRNIQIENIRANNITAITSISGRLYIGTDRGLYIK